MLGQSVVLSCPSIFLDCVFGALRPGHRGRGGSGSSEAPAGLTLAQAETEGVTSARAQGWPRRPDRTAGWTMARGQATLGPRPRAEVHGQEGQSLSRSRPRGHCLGAFLGSSAHPPQEVSALTAPPWKHWLNRRGAGLLPGGGIPPGSAVAA